jgi:hypothetical protein
MDAVFVFDLDTDNTLSVVVREHGKLHGSQLVRCVMFEFALKKETDAPETAMFPASRLISALYYPGTYKASVDDNEATFVVFHESR